MKSKYSLPVVAACAFAVVLCAGSCKKGDQTTARDDAAAVQTSQSAPAAENMEQVLLSFRSIDIIISAKGSGTKDIGRILISERGEPAKKVLECESMGQGTSCELVKVTSDASKTFFRIKNMICLDEDGGCNKNETSFYNCSVDNSLILAQKQSGALELKCGNCEPTR